MGRVGEYSAMTENDKPPQVHNQQQQQPPNDQPTHHVATPLQPLIPDHSEHQLQQEEAEAGINSTTAAGQQQQIFIQPPAVQIYIQPPPPPPPPVYQYPPPVYQYPPPPQPPPQVECPPYQYPQEWTTGLFDCLEHPENAIITLVCPCVTFGQIAEIIDNGRTSCETAGCYYTTIALCIACPCIYSFTYRGKLRGHFGLDEIPAPDCITHLCCEYCALCQEYRELNNRGYNPSAGWMNVSKQHGMIPPGRQIMR